MDLIKCILPSYIELEGFFFDIKTDFRAWLAFNRLIKDEATTWEQIENTIYISEPPKDREKGLKALLDFFQPAQELPRKMSGGTNAILLDYDLDADLIYSAFLERYNIDLVATDDDGRAVSLHWWKFLALLNGLHDTRLNEVMSYRAYNPNDKDDYKKQMTKLKRAWEIIPKPTAAEIKEHEEFNALLEKKTK